MAGTQRQLEIMDELRLRSSCRINELAKILNVSEETIRRNVRELAKEGLVRKVHGGVTLNEHGVEPPFHQRMSENRDLKQRVARKVASLIRNGDSLILDIGSTTAYVAQALANHKDLFVVTNSIAVAHTLATRNGNRVMMAGGELRSHDAGAFGAEALNFVCQFSVQHAVLSVAAIDEANGFMLYDLREAEFSREIMRHAGRTIIAADSTKFGRKAPVQIAEPKEIDILVSDAAPTAPIRAMLNANEVEIVLAD